MDPKDIDDVKKFIDLYKNAKPAKYSELFILGYLSFQDMSGYDIYKLIKKTADAGGSWYRLNKATTYNTLNRMNKDGFIEIVKTITDGKKPPKDIYSITDQGQKYLKEMVYSELKNPPLILINFLPALTFSKVLTNNELKEVIKIKIEQIEFILGLLKLSSRISPGTITELIIESRTAIYNSLLKLLKKMLKVLDEKPIEEFMKVQEFDGEKVKHSFMKVSNKEE